MRVDELRSINIFEGLRDDQLAELIEGGTEVPVEPGVDLFHQGEHADFWWVLVEGSVDLVRRVGREDTTVGRLDVPGRWAGGFRAWDEHGVYLATGRGSTSGRVLRVPAEVLRERTNAWFPLGGHLIRGLYGTARSIESTARQRESLVTLIPVGTRYDEVVSRFGRPDEEHERVTPPGRRTLLYRANHGAVHHEVAIELHDDRVREITCITSR